MILSPAAIHRDHLAPEPAVVRELERLDSELFVTWSELYLDRSTGRPLVRRDGTVMRDPRWHVWRRDGRGVVHHLFSADRCDHRIPAKIRRDAARWVSEREIHEMIERANERQKARKEDRYATLQRDVVSANESILETIFEGDNITRPAQPHLRDAKIVSYGGQPIRRSAFDAIPKTNEEIGLELPDWKKEMED